MALQGLYMTPISSDRSICKSWLPPLLIRSTAHRRKPFVVAVADKRDNLDHLQQRTTTGRPQQLQFNKRPPQVAPPSGTVVWDRFPTAKTVQQMMDTMERLVDDPLAFSNTSWPSRSERMQDGYGRGRTPWAIREREADYKMRFDMPGMTREDVKVWVEDNMVVVRAEKVGVKEGEKQQANANGSAAADDEDEWPVKSYGKYGFRLAVPENIEFEKIKAEVKDGVLTITVPKASNNSKVIDINVQ